MLHAAFPDGRTTIDDIITEGDKVVVRGTMTGTHSAEFMGIPATGKAVTISGIDITRFENGLSAEHWGQWDVAGLMVQLGVAPPPPGAPPTEGTGRRPRHAGLLLLPEITAWWPLRM